MTHAHRATNFVSVCGGAIALASLLVTMPAAAQDTAPPAPAPAAAADAGGTDHSRVVGHFAVGALGVQAMNIGVGGYADGDQYCGTVKPGSAAGTTPDPSCLPVITGTASVNAPVIGIRYWLTEKFGLDVGIGIGIYSGSTTQYPYPTNTVNNTVQFSKDKASATAFILHAGVPIALAEAKHFTFEVIPELDVGIASGSQKDQQAPAEPVPAGQMTGTVPPARPDIGLGGFMFDVGARIGGELQFGFIGIPELALQATVGLQFTTSSTKVSVNSNSATDSNTSIQTSVQSAPWALFTNNIAALYYF